MSSRKRWTLSVVFVLVTLLSMQLSIPTAAQRDSGTASGRVIAVFRNTTLPADADTRVSRAGGKVIARLEQVGILVAVPAAGAQASFLSRLRADSAVLAADDDLV